MTTTPHTSHPTTAATVQSLLILLLLCVSGSIRAVEGITSLPCRPDFVSTEPFEGGTINSSNTAIGNVLSVSNTTATATFTGGYAMRGNETVTIRFTAYHGYYNNGTNSTIAVKNTAGETLVSYTYNQVSTNVTDVSLGGETAAGFEPFLGISKYNATQNANGIAGNGKPYQSTTGYNPTITMTICGNRLVTFRFECAAQSVTRTYSDVLDGKLMTLGSIVITDGNDNADRSIAINNLTITSALYTCDYESTGNLTDWTTGTNGRYTPVIMEESGGNHFLTVNQDQRNNNGAVLTNTNVSGSARAGEDFTLSFDMKLGRSNRNQTPTQLTVYDATNTTELFSLADQGTGNQWNLTVAGGDPAVISLDGTGSSTATDGTALDALTWYNVKLSMTDALLYVTITSRDGTYTYWRGGHNTSSTGGLGKMTFATSRYHANLAIDNIVVNRYATTTLVTNGKTETYTIVNSGDLRQVEEGSSFILEYGDTWQVQSTQTNGSMVGAYCMDAVLLEDHTGKNTQAYAAASPTATSKPTSGTFYKFTPKFDGTLSISGWVNSVNNITLQRATDGVVVGTYSPADTTPFSNQAFSAELTADTEYYLYASTPQTANCAGSNTNAPTLFLAGLAFTQSAMSREIKVCDLLYLSQKSTQSQGLDRTIPGFELTFSGGDKVEKVANLEQLKLSQGGSMTITLRQNAHDAKITSITLTTENTATGTKATFNGSEKDIAAAGTKQTYTLASPNGQLTIACTAGNFRFSAFRVSYSSDDDDPAAWLDETKTTPGFSFKENHQMRVPADGQPVTFNYDSFRVTSPSRFSLPVTYTTDNTTTCTINSDGTNGQLLKGGEATITATLPETIYFAQATATCTVSNVLKPGESYTRATTNMDNVRINAQAASDNTPLTLTGTTAATMTFNTVTNEQITTATGTELTLTNNTSSNITIEAMAIYQKNPVAWLYYNGQEGNYAEQVHFQGFESGTIKGFRVLDIGDPVRPIDLTSFYELKSGSNYTLTEGSHVKTAHFGSTFNTENGNFTVNGKNTVGSEESESLPLVSHLLTKTTGAEIAYDDELTATAKLRILSADDDDTYHTWDFTTSVSANGQMDGRWSWDPHGYYQASLPEYLPILNPEGNTLEGNEGLLIVGDVRYYSGTTGLRLNLTKVNSRLKFPVKKGMEIKIEMASGAADIEHIITPVTDVNGEPINKLYIEQQGIASPVTAYFLAADDGAVELLSMDKMGGYVKRITLEVPRIHFNEEVVTMKNESGQLTNIATNTGDAVITYSIEGSYDLDGTPAATPLATLPNPNEGKINITTDNEGYVVVNAVNSRAAGIQPKKGSYRIYLIDFHFAPTTNDESTEPLNLSTAPNGEVTFRRLPIGVEKVVQPVTYSMSYRGGTPRGRITQTTKEDPTQTTYELTAYSSGVIRVTATTGHIVTHCDLTITGGNQFAEVAPTRRIDELSKDAEDHYFFRNELPEGFESGTTTLQIDKVGTVDCSAATIVSDNGHKYAQINNITGYGALRLTATNDNNTPDEADDKRAHFILTIAYPASTGKKWDFYRMKHGEPATYGLTIGKLDDYDGNSTQTKDQTVTGSNGWTTDTHWTKVYRKGTEQPRWAYSYSARGDNAFIIEETAGLQIESGQKGFYIDNPHTPDEFEYNHIGLHNNASVTIPRLKQGDYISLNLARTISNSGAIIAATNITDLAGTVVDHTFTITHSQTDYRDGGGTAKDANGARIIPGYYTFRAAADGDVTFTLVDEGYLDILSIEIYNDEFATPVGEKRDATNGYIYTMKDIVTDGTYTSLPATLFKEDDESRTFDLAICHYMWSTGVGPADYELIQQVGKLHASLENIDWYSDGGAAYKKGRLTINEGFGKMLLRMNNYTAEGRYLIGYTPTYSLVTGHKPHQSYPYTWNFENISGGAVKSKTNNAYNSIRSDYYTWTNLGYETFALDTEIGSGTLYVPGATLTTAARDLGAKGTIEELNLLGEGCDELNGLGFNGKIIIKLAQQDSSLGEAPSTLPGTVPNSLLSYAVDNNEEYQSQKTVEDDKTIWTSKELTAGDGKVVFGNPGKIESTKIGSTDEYRTNTHWAYKLDGGNTKYVLLKPERPLQDGDQIQLKGFSSSSVLNSGFSFYAAANDDASKSLATINWTDATANKEQTVTYTVTHGDGLAGLSSIYVFRAKKNYTAFLSEVSVTGSDDTAPAAYGKEAVTCAEDVTVTIPDLQEDYYVYIKATAPPTAASVTVSNLTAAIAADGLDAAAGVYKYKVVTAGTADLTFATGTKIYRIGVTDIQKPLKQVGSGDAWATESRDHAIDYMLTGLFTVNNVKPNIVTAQSYALKKVTVKMNEVTDGAMPQETGMVLRLKLKHDTEEATTAALTAFGKGKDYNSEAATASVPLFYPSYSTPVLSTAAVHFGGTLGNLMKDNLTEQTFSSETEVINGVNYTRFILATKYMKWQKVGNEPVSPTTENFIDEGDVPVFYRLHLFDDAVGGVAADDLNTIGDHKAYMLLRTGNLPEALWNSSSPAKEYIAIAGISDMDDINDQERQDDSTANDSRTYNINGQVVNDKGTLPPGVYIRNGRKFVIR